MKLFVWDQCLINEPLNYIVVGLVHMVSMFNGPLLPLDDYGKANQNIHKKCVYRSIMYHPSSYGIKIIWWW